MINDGGNHCLLTKVGNKRERPPLHNPRPYSLCMLTTSLCILASSLCLVLRNGGDTKHGASP